LSAARLDGLQDLGISSVGKPPVITASEQLPFQPVVERILFLISATANRLGLQEQASDKHHGVTLLSG
jgi:hypothetical protein